ncbi:hypothetical protein MSIM_14640 [Mycobacterium simiae]|nr:hypothetical protein MSIM_14640 [Mycobacterium simiae]
MIVVLLALVAADHKSANSLVRQQSFIDGEVGEVGLYGHPFLLIQGLAGFDGIQRRRRVTRVVRKRVGWQTRREVVTHAPSLRRRAVVTPAGKPARAGFGLGRAARQHVRLLPVRDR